ncbi:hypothetical protein [Pseudoxanthobacter sp.]|uniref:hypothetical protein n=1 Tax=Pseudoxanthobacter sp. TaxID=1925742 RepID=UPI002FDF82F2
MKSSVILPAAYRRFGALCAGAVLLLAAGCSNDPTSRVIDISFRPKAPPQGVVIPETQPDGYPNLSYRPVASPPQRMTGDQQQAFRDKMEKKADRGKAIAASAPGTVGSPEELQKIGATHADDARAAIEGGGSSQTGAETQPPLVPGAADPDFDAGATN